MMLLLVICTNSENSTLVTAEINEVVTQLLGPIVEALLRIFGSPVKSHTVLAVIL